jgi:hypothetical protein
MPKRIAFFQALLMLKLSQDLLDQTNMTPHKKGKTSGAPTV